MAQSSRISYGYSLIELMVVLFIVGVLAMVGVVSMGDREGTSVRSLMDQVEGTIMQAQKTAQATGQDVCLSANGTWTAAGQPSLSGSSPFILDPRRFQNPSANPDPYSGARLGSDSETFISLYRSSARDHIHAAVATDATALGVAASLLTVSPFNSATDTSFKDAFNNPLANGGQNRAIANGVNYRFNTGFAIVVVGLKSGATDTSGPVGVLVVPQNSANVYRFYRRAGETTWKRT
jgi:prepilin-type N-terminal cleavage/methylation domain-containing protein